MPTEGLPRESAEPIAGVRKAALGGLPEYRALIDRHVDGVIATARAPALHDLAARARNLKASADFLGGTLAGICELRSQDWLDADHPPHSHAFVFLVEFSREAPTGEPGAE